MIRSRTATWLLFCALFTSRATAQDSSLPGQPEGPGLLGGRTVLLQSFRSAYGNAFGLIAISKQLDLVAADASREGERLDKQQAPAKEVARQMKQEEDKRVAQEKARLVNKPKFRP